jgi:hypothetical protein
MLSSYNSPSENTPVGRYPAGEDPDRSRNRPDRVDEPPLEGPPPIDEPKREEDPTRIDAESMHASTKTNPEFPAPAPQFWHLAYELLDTASDSASKMVAARGGFCT